MAGAKRTLGDLMTVDQVAAFLQLNKLTVYKFIRAGDLPAVRLGRSFRIRRADVDEFLEARKVAPKRAPRPQPAEQPGAGSRPEVRPRIERRQLQPEREPARADESSRTSQEDRRQLREAMISSNPLEWVIRGLH
ncbi:MAG: hypothetical protein XU14_C0082G0005 [Armatimonadetes bacterium CSP1-3]|nr:MAG: hypothetical protein XU14_C0082G0005 [Armatimonadetes bacterium CSP1-3]